MPMSIKTQDMINKFPGSLYRGGEPETEEGILSQPSSAIPAIQWTWSPSLVILAKVRGGVFEASG
jgi:hypothetical protein